MNKSIVAGLIAMALSTAAPSPSVSAIPLPPPLAPTASADLVENADIFCGPEGCGPIWPGPRRRQWDWGPWGHVYRPACPIGYYYACRRGPLGYGQCACWPYRSW